MRRHAFDPLSFIFGVGFVALAGALSVKGLDVGASALRWVAVALLIVVGSVMLMTSKTGAPSDDRRDRS